MTANTETITKEKKKTTPHPHPPPPTPQKNTHTKKTWQEYKLRSGEKHPHNRSPHPADPYTQPRFDCNQNGPCRRGSGRTTTAGRGDNSLHFLSWGGGGAPGLRRHATRSVQRAGPIEKTDDCLGVGCGIDLALPCLRKLVVAPYHIHTAGRSRTLEQTILMSSDRCMAWLGLAWLGLAWLGSRAVGLARQRQIVHGSIILIAFLMC